VPLVASPANVQTAPEVPPTSSSPEIDLGDAPGIYISVMVAAFGGLSVTLGKQGEHMKLHPIWPLLLCLPVFATQISSLLVLRSGLDTDTQVYQPGDGHSEALLKLKLVLIVVVFLANFKVLLIAVTHLVFCLNPVTWVEVDHFEMKDGAIMHFLPRPIRSLLSLPTTAACAIVSILLNFVSSYMVCIDSVSIILSSATAQDAIFNSLGIGFITELKRVWWEFCKHSFRLSPLRAFEFKLRKERTWAGNGEMSDETLSKVPIPCLIQALVRATTWKCMGMKTTFLRVGFGSNRAQKVLSLMLVVTIFTRQLFVTLYAVDTNVLPAARDLCEELKLSQADGTIGARLWDMAEWLMFVNMDEELKFAADANKGSLQSRCDDNELARMKLSNMRGLMHKYVWQILAFMGVMMTILVAPSVVIALYGLLTEKSKTDEQQDIKIDDMDSQMKALDDRLCAAETSTTEIGSLKNDFAKLREELTDLRRRH